MEAPIFVRSKIAIPFSIGLASDHVKDHVNNPQTCHHSPTATLPFCQKSSWFPNNFPGWMSNKSQFVVGSIPQKPNVLQWNPMTSSPFLRGKSNPKAPVSDVKSQEIPTTKPFPTNGVAGHHWPLRHEGPWWYLPWKMVLELGEPHIFFFRIWYWSLLIYVDLSGWWFGTFLCFPYIGNLIIPSDFHIFQKGCEVVRPPRDSPTKCNKV